MRGSHRRYVSYKKYKIGHLRPLQKKVSFSLSISVMSLVLAANKIDLQFEKKKCLYTSIHVLSLLTPVLYYCPIIKKWVIRSVAFPASHTFRIRASHTHTYEYYSKDPNSQPATQTIHILGGIFLATRAYTMMMVMMMWQRIFMTHRTQLYFVSHLWRPHAHKWIYVCLKISVQQCAVSKQRRWWFSVCICMVRLSH